MLTDQDYELLKEGLDSIKRAESLESLAIMMMTGMLSHGDKKAIEDAERKDEERMKSFKAKEERIIMVKAKLLKMQGAAADELLASTK